MKAILAVVCAAILGAAAVALRSAQVRDAGAGVDAIFARWNSTATPGCAVGAAVGGQPVLAKAYGMADLEHDVKNTPETIFEAGSVSKQFTAASILLLAREGKLSLDDPAKKYVPELSDAASPILIRHMLNHTSGLRDWGSVEAIAGWPRGTRVYTHAHVLEIVGRQHALNFPPGTRWSYSNTGYNLSAVIVSRVSGMPFADFTRRRLFEPLGMTHTSWRDDHTRIVKQRAIAYDDEKDGFHTDMPFEQVHGNGGLLTTVGDLLKWNENFVTPRVGDAAFVEQLQQPGRFNDGRAHNYAFGLTIGTHKGVREVAHGGATAGYRAHLVRYPDPHVSVAVLCNASSAQAGRYASAVADLYLGDRLKDAPGPTATYTLSPGDRDRLAGLYRNTQTGVPTLLSVENDGLHAQRDGLLVPTSGTRAITASDTTWEFDGRGGVRVTDPFGTVDALERVSPANPAAAELKALTGVYASDEAEAVLTVAMDGYSLVVRRRPDATLKLTPAYADAFTAPQLGLVIFRRDASRRVSELSVVQDRVWDLRFARQQPGRSVSQ